MYKKLKYKLITAKTQQKKNGVQRAYYLQKKFENSSILKITLATDLAYVLRFFAYQ